MNDATQFFDTVAGGGGYEIERSLRFNRADSANLSRTPSIASNRKTWTWAGWVKMSGLGPNQYIFNTGGGLPIDGFAFTANNNIKYRSYNGTSEVIQLITTQVFRDASAWYHIVFAMDTTQATESNRLKLYVNGTQVTTFSSQRYGSQNYDTNINNTAPHLIGTYAGLDYLDSYLADIHLIDGQALDPTSFGEFDTNGVWQPIAYEGTYGTNGFHLPFSDNSTAAALGTDTSGNGNTWTVNNLSVAAGAGNDSLVDSPTNYGTDTGAGGEVRGNYATWLPTYGSTGSFSNGNLDVVTASNNTAAIPTTIFPSSGKWYWEVLIVNNGGLNSYIRIGVCNTAGVAGDLGGSANGWCFLGDGRVFYNGTASSYGTSVTTGDIVNVALDLDTGKIWYGKNGTWMASGSPSTGANPSQTFTANQSMSPAVASGSQQPAYTLNAGARPFAYTAPSGFKALCTTNLSEPTIADGSTVMDVVLYTGNGSTQTISGLNFSSDLIWIKRRDSSGQDHVLQDSVRGFTSTTKLSSSSTAQENAGTNSVTDPKWGYVTGASSTSFDITASTSGDQVNKNTWSYAAWCWDAGSSTVTNTQGSITSQVRANPSAGFSVVTYTGTGSAATVGHGLGVAPSLIIVKSRSNTGDWPVYTSATGAGNKLYLNLTDASAGSSNWNSTAPTSTVFSVGSGGVETNISTYTYVAYCFAPVAGYSSFGSYTGNGSTNGPFVYTGFRPRWILFKRSSTTSNWVIFDTSRGAYNSNTPELYANASNAETAVSNRVDILSNGFKLRTNIFPNDSATTFIYAAFAESPFQYARAR